MLPAFRNFSQVRLSELKQTNRPDLLGETGGQADSGPTFHIDPAKQDLGDP